MAGSVTTLLVVSMLGAIGIDFCGPVCAVGVAALVLLRTYVRFVGRAMKKRVSYS